MNPIWNLAKGGLALTVGFFIISYFFPKFMLLRNMGLSLLPVLVLFLILAGLIFFAVPITNEFPINSIIIVSFIAISLLSTGILAISSATGMSVIGNLSNIPQALGLTWGEFMIFGAVQGFMGWALVEGPSQLFKFAGITS